MAVADDARRAWAALATILLSDEQHDRFIETCRALSLPHPGALKLLLQLDVGESPTMGDAARQMNCDASYITALVDALEDRGLAVRRVDATDRRVKMVDLTESGRDAQAQALELLSEPSPRMNRLSAAETRTLARLLDKLADG